MSDISKTMDRIIGLLVDVVVIAVIVGALAAVVAAFAFGRCALLAHSTGRVVETTWSGCMVETKDGLVPEANWRGGP